MTTVHGLSYHFLKPVREHFEVFDMGILGREMEAERDSAHLPQPFRTVKPLSMMYHAEVCFVSIQARNGLPIEVRWGLTSYSHEQLSSPP